MGKHERQDEESKDNNSMVGSDSPSAKRKKLCKKAKTNKEEIDVDEVLKLKDTPLKATKQEGNSCEYDNTKNGHSSQPESLEEGGVDKSMSESLPEEDAASVNQSKRRRTMPTEDVEETVKKEVKQNGANESEDEEKDEQKKKGGKKRRRKKGIREEIRKQMEFYFCDANLRKDRYMKKIVDNDPQGWVSISEFLKFNKVKSILEEKQLEVIEISRALKDSLFLEVSPDFQKIRRNFAKHPYKEKSPEAIDECTIYVQHLPPEASIDWLNAVFLEFGPIDYVSLPRAPTGRHKGFGFVEFTTEKHAADACKCYGYRHGKKNAEVWQQNTHEGEMLEGRHGEPHTDSTTGSFPERQRPHLQVLSKREWIGYKNRYLKLRKQSARMVKNFLNVSESSTITGNQDEGQANSKVKPSEQISENASKEQRQPTKQHESKKMNPDLKKSDGQATDTLNNNEHQNVLSFDKGCIVKVEASRRLLKTDKASLRSCGFDGIAYVDLIESDPVAFVRFEQSSQAQAFISCATQTDQQTGNGQRSNKSDESAAKASGDLLNTLNSLSVKSCSMLEGDEETNYWQRINMLKNRRKGGANAKQNGTGAQKVKANGDWKKRTINAESAGPKQNQDATVEHNSESKGTKKRRHRGTKRLNDKYEKHMKVLETNAQSKVMPVNKKIVFSDD